MKYKELDNLILDTFKEFDKTGTDYDGLAGKVKVPIKTIIGLHQIYKSNRELSYHEWIKKLLPYAEKGKKYYSEKLKKKFIILYEGSIVFEDWTIYLKSEWEKMKGVEDIEKVYDVKNIFNGEIIK